MIEATSFFAGVSAGVLIGTTVMALAYFHFMVDKKEEAEPEVRQNGGRAPRELNRCSKMHNVLLIDRGKRRSA